MIPDTCDSCFKTFDKLTLCGTFSDDELRVIQDDEDPDRFDTVWDLCEDCVEDLIYAEQEKSSPGKEAQSSLEELPAMSRKGQSDPEGI